MEAAVQRFGKLDVLVNNAGIFKLAKVEETSSELWDEIMGINAKGVFLGTKYAIPEMRKNGGGSIVNISSVAGLIGTRYSAAYGASKGRCGSLPSPLQSSTPKIISAPTPSTPV